MGGFMVTVGRTVAPTIDGAMDGGSSTTHRVVDRAVRCPLWLRVVIRPPPPVARGTIPSEYDGGDIVGGHVDVPWRRRCAD